MRVCFVSRESVSTFRENGLALNVDITVFGFDGLGEVCYERELSGETSYFENVALLSKERKGIVVSGCVTNVHGHKRNSAVVAEKGKLLGVSDALYAFDRRSNAGGALKLYDTALGKTGVLVADDLYAAELWKGLSLCGCECVVCPFGRVQNEMQTVLLRAYAYTYGLSVLFCGKGLCAVVEGDGRLRFSSPHSPVETTFERRAEYHLLERRQRGFLSSSL